jgi:16S rRNA (guanine527-N7)-methyltransferase
LYEHHVLHSLALAKYNHFDKVKTILDVGTGGGFPGIPLAIMFPDMHFTLLDATGKKIKIVDEIANTLRLDNVTGIHARVEDHKGSYDLIVSRALSSLTQMVAWTKHLVPSKHWIVLKGGNKHEIRKELLPIYKISFTPVSDYFTEEYFKEKWIVDVHRGK